jgi:hypothetical protein
VRLVGVLLGVYLGLMIATITAGTGSCARGRGCSGGQSTPVEILNVGLAAVVACVTIGAALVLARRVARR